MTAQYIFLILYITIVTLLVIFTIFVFQIYNNKKINNICKNMYNQRAIYTKILSLLKNKYTTNAFTENSEIIYQDLLQYLIPIMADLEISPRNSTEHPLWKSIGAIIDESNKNVFIIEKLRRSIKNNPDILENVNNFITKTEKFLNYISLQDPEHILATTFIDGLLGQALRFFTQAKKLVENE